ncbi:hypothetical protein F5148DRAFT_1153804 [Russula earlei]|uniref:Uncharacterized protein n=1 Tax=Russula earlei TaxID=71964 RepID=A0ACC0TTG5_9AGAM|nr:hypothetical protein F5148DRAFT_1153804 [Russula earlei]
MYNSHSGNHNEMAMTTTHHSSLILLSLFLPSVQRPIVPFHKTTVSKSLFLPRQFRSGCLSPAYATPGQDLACHGHDHNDNAAIKRGLTMATTACYTCQFPSASRSSPVPSAPLDPLPKRAVLAAFKSLARSSPVTMFTAVQHSPCTRPFARQKGPILLAFKSIAWSWPATVGFICLYPTPNNNAMVMTTTTTMEWQHCVPVRDTRDLCQQHGQDLGHDAPVKTLARGQSVSHAFSN